MKKWDYGSKAGSEDPSRTNQSGVSNKRGDTMANSVKGIKERLKILSANAEEERQSD